jgi:DnaJ like chaperone protein
VVVRSEVDAFERIVEVPPPEHERIKRLFDLAKATTDGFEAYARQVAGLFADEPALLEDVLDGLFHIAKADGAVHEREFSYLKAVAREFGLGDADFSRIAASHLKHPDDPYEVLGADRRMSDADLKRLYRKRVSESHPDREIARGLPAEAIRIATERLAAINAAWARIEAERGLT